MATPQLDNRQLGTDTARLNLLTNGGFEIWQRGTSIGPTQASAGYHADRWYISGGGGTGTIASAKDAANRDTWGAACAAVTYSHVAGTLLAYTQDLKASEAGVAGGTVSLSMRVRTSVANLVRIGIHNGSAWTYSAY